MLSISLVFLLARTIVSFSIVTLPSAEVENNIAKADDPGQWRELAPITHGARQEHSVSSIGTDVYIVGGMSSLSANATSALSLAQAQAYSTVSNEWRDIAPLPVRINHGNIASLGGKLYLLGALSGGLIWRGMGNSYSYDPEADEWEQLPSMPGGQYRGASAIGVWRDSVLVAGGLNSSIPGVGQFSVPTVSSYDTRRRKWSELPNLPEARDHVGGAVINDVFYVVGGRTNGAWNVKGTVYALNLTNTESGWVEKAPMPTPRGGLAAAAVGKSVYTFGGEGNPRQVPNGVFNEVEIYDTQADRWEKLAPMPFPRHGTNAAAVDGKLYLPGGGNITGAGAVTVNDVFVPIK